MRAAILKGGNRERHGSIQVGKRRRKRIFLAGRVDSSSGAVCGSGYCSGGCACFRVCKKAREVGIFRRGYQNQDTLGRRGFGASPFLENALVGNSCPHIPLLLI